MLPIEESVINTLRRRGPCCLDDVVAFLPNFSWAEVCLAVYRMSRDGRVLVCPLGYSTYHIALGPQSAHLTSATSQNGMQSSLVG